MAKGKIIFLNGVSSSGKSSLARCLQSKLTHPAYHLSYDLFKQMASPSHHAADFWAISKATSMALHHSIALFSDLGLDLIVDHVILATEEGQYTLQECLHLLASYPVLFVRVDCPLEELERRELQRGDRRLGQARAQFEKIDSQISYDLIVDNYAQSLESCADQIIASLHKPESWKAFQNLYQSSIHNPTNQTL